MAYAEGMAAGFRAKTRNLLGSVDPKDGYESAFRNLLICDGFYAPRISVDFGQNAEVL
jgi:hypothetical protein